MIQYVVGAESKYKSKLTCPKGPSLANPIRPTGLDLNINLDLTHQKGLNFDQMLIQYVIGTKSRFNTFIGTKFRSNITPLRPKNGI